MPGLHVAALIQNARCMIWQNLPTCPRQPMRSRRFIILILVAMFASCRGVPQRAPLPEGHEIRVGQLVFHSDFDLPADHRLVRELVQERDDICNTLGFQPTNESIHVYLFRDAECYREYLM